MGDSLLFNSVVYELGRQTGRRYFLGTKHPEIYKGNPHAFVLPFSQYTNYRIFKILSPLLGAKTHHIDYYHKGHPPRQHLLELLSDRVGLRIPPNRPAIFLSQAEQERRLLPSREKPWVAMQSTGLATWTENKNWGVDNFRAVARLLAKDFCLVQLGAAGDPSLGVDLELQGRLELREVFIVLRQCKTFVGQVGFLMHAAAAVDLPSVIVYGGFEAPWQSGYGWNINLYSDVECAPCWLETKCPHEKKCLAQITPQQVFDRARALIDSAESK